MTDKITITFALAPPVVRLATEFLTYLRNREDAVSVISDKLDQLEASQADEESRVNAAVADLQSQITTLQGEVANGTATPEELARLDTLIQRNKDLLAGGAAPPAAGNPPVIA